MKITTITKNRDEKGSRAEFFGSNPHSKGDLFSRSSLIFFEISVATLTNKNSIQDEIKSRLKLGNVCYYSVQNFCLPVCYPKS